MDSTLPTMESLDLDKLEPVALQHTLEFLGQNPVPDDPFGIEGMLAADFGETDWMDIDCMAGWLQEGGESDLFVPVRVHAPASEQTLGQYAHESRVSTELESIGVSPQGSKPGFSAPAESGSDMSNTSDGQECSWNGCKVLLFEGQELTEHLICHAADARIGWTPPARCRWENCSSKAQFKNISLYKAHLKNIPTHPVVCTKPNCSYKKPFRNRGDRNRHVLSIHSFPEWNGRECPYPSCEVTVKNFGRRDKWLKHIRETEHENDAFCPWSHCRNSSSETFKGFSIRGQIFQHFDSVHSINMESALECGIGSCQTDSRRGYWSYLGAYDHVKIDHEIDDPSSFCKFNSGLITFASERTTELHNCTICGPPNAIQHHSQEEKASLT